jgi:predicted enzyme related to lactoylglutathione lyase
VLGICITTLDRRASQSSSRDYFPRARGSNTLMNARCASPVVHLELHTPDPAGALSFYAQLCGWSAQRIETGAGSYVALELGEMLGGGAVQCPTERALWLPYVEVTPIGEMTDRARLLGAEVLLAPREGPAGWRSVVATPAAGELALWQPKR